MSGNTPSFRCRLSETALSLALLGVIGGVSVFGEVPLGDELVGPVAPETSPPPKTSTGTVVSVDRETGAVTVDIDGEQLTLQFPRESLDGFAPGDQVAVEVESPAEDSGTAMRPPPETPPDDKPQGPPAPPDPPADAVPPASASAS